MYKNYKIQYIGISTEKTGAPMVVEVLNTSTNELFIDELYTEKQCYKYFVKLYANSDERFK